MYEETEFMSKLNDVDENVSAEEIRRVFDDNSKIIFVKSS